ncbi:MAG TPA: FecR domain-containing protein [Candidatus Angelobacter sp.]|nr:FecR domain-containing protein [Candidatus Angelobacter sp.]
MKRQEDKPQEMLEQAVAAIRADQPSPELMRAAGERVWQQLSQNAVGVAEGESIRGCADVRTLLLQYRRGELGLARKLLVSAHLNECVECRREAEMGGVGSVPSPWTQALPRAANPSWRYAMAAAAIVVLAIAGYFVSGKLLSGPAGMRARVESFDGVLLRVGFSGEQPLKAGEELGEGEEVRTGAGGHAMLRLRDGSLVEVNERSQLGVTMGRRDTTIQLDRGKIIVQAAKRKTGHLYVAANDVKVAVTGTVFSVNHGIKGSRVSVIEGEVHVAGTGSDGLFHNAVLHPGEQMATEAARPVPVKQEIAWSHDLDKHLALLAEFAHLSNKLQTVQMPGLRYESKILPNLPGDTVLFASIPNLGDAVQQANQLFQQELQTSAVLNEWWQQAQSRRNGPDFGQILDELHSLSQYVGDEIVFSVAIDGNQCTPLAAAPVQKPGLKQFIEQELAKRSGEAHYGDIQVLDEAGLATAASQKRGGLYMLVRPDFVAASPDISALRAFNTSLNQNDGAGLASTPFGQRLTAEYQNGAGLLFGANLAAITAYHQEAHYSNPHRRGNFEKTGLADVQYLIAERKETSGEPLNRAELSFNGARHGLASWLGAPAPIGGLDFVSKDAGAAAAFIAKSPSQMLDDILSIAGASGQANLSKGESELKIQFHQDLADTLGGEVTFALDGPILPTPSWKMIVEVYNPGRLQATIQQLVNDANDHAKDAQHKIALDQENVNGLTYYTLHATGGNKPVEINYTFTDGYLVMGSSRALVMNALTIHQSGNSLARSSDFRSLLPQDQHTDVSALLYQNLAPVVGPVMSQLTPSQLQSLQQLAAESKPSVVCAYGEPNAIRVASNSRLFGLDLNTLTLSTLMRMTQAPGSR